MWTTLGSIAGQAGGASHPARHRVGVVLPGLEESGHRHRPRGPGRAEFIGPGPQPFTERRRGVRHRGGQNRARGAAGREQRRDRPAAAPGDRDHQPRALGVNFLGQLLLRNGRHAGFLSSHGPDCLIVRPPLSSRQFVLYTLVGCSTKAPIRRNLTISTNHLPLAPIDGRSETNLNLESGST